MDILALVLVIIGAINWGSVGLFGADIVGTLFGGHFSIISRIIFTVIGLAGLYCLTLYTRVDREHREHREHREVTVR